MTPWSIRRNVCGKAGNGFGSLQPLCASQSTRSLMQVVDRAWRFIKDRLKINQNVKCNSTLLQAKIRSAQFEYWQRGKDAWTSTGELFTWYMSNITEKF